MSEMRKYVRNTEAILERLYSQYETIKDLYPVNDIRKAFLGIPSSIIYSYKLHLCAVDGTVTWSGWWESVGATNVTPIQMNGLIEELFSLSNRSYLIFFFATVEYLMKKTINFFTAGFDPEHKIAFKKVYDEYLRKLNLDQYIPLYDVVRLYRNTIHSNGYHIPHNGKDENIVYKERVYDFIKLQPVRGFHMDEVFFLLDEIANSLIDIVNANPMKEPVLIEDKFY